jgi:hypothetical protein
MNGKVLTSPPHFYLKSTCVDEPKPNHYNTKDPVAGALFAVPETQGEHYGPSNQSLHRMVAAAYRAKQNQQSPEYRCWPNQ